MLRRPQADETDEQLLKLQAEFLKQKNKKSTTHCNDAETLAKDNAVPILQLSSTAAHSILGDVVEKKCPPGWIYTTYKANNSGFPSVFLVDTREDAPKTKKGKSLFAQKFNKNNKQNSEVPMVVDNMEQFVIDPSDQEIHEENMMKINSMSEDEIIDQKSAIQSALDPELLTFLKKRGAKKAATQNVNDRDETHEGITETMDVESVKNNIIKTLEADWLNIDSIQPDKLQWIGDIPDVKALDPNEPYSARFNFSGDLQPFKADVDVRTSLHHHGDEPERPGYTIQELYQLSRSTVLQQRTLALTTLAAVIRKTKMGYYDSCFDGALLHKLVESDVFFLLRFAMDDRATTAAAVHCLYELFVSRSDEVCLDRLWNCPGADDEPYLYVTMQLDKDTEEKDLKDHEIIALDLVRGVLRTDLLVRFEYILSNFDLDVICISKVFEIITRVCRHSSESCEKVLECSEFISYLFDHVNSSRPCPESVKLLRVLSNHDKIAQSLCINHNKHFSFIFKIIEMDEPLFKLKLECLNLWISMLRRGLMFDYFPMFASHLKRLLHFYVSTVDVEHGRFDFELFSSIVGVVNILASFKVHLDDDFESNLQICLQKWLSQIVSDRPWNFSVAKAVGCAFQYFVVKFNARGITSRDVSFLNNLSRILEGFLNCKGFREMCETLAFYSHIRNYESVTRDPDNLPSLCSVYKNADDYLRLVQDKSAFPLMHSLAEFILAVSGVNNQLNNLPKILMQNFEVYRQKILKCSETSFWFARTEVTFLISLLKLCMKCNHSESVMFAFRLVPYLRTDDTRVLHIIDMITSVSDFSHISEIYKQYVSKEFKPLLYHHCETFPRHWVYEPIAASPVGTLKCITYILENCPDLIANVPPTLRFVHLCLVLLNDDNVFNSEICPNLEKCLDDVLLKFDQLDLNSVSVGEKSFYELYRDLVTEYASSSYGHPLFAKIVAVPLAQKFDISYRKLVWSEFMHALRVLTLPSDVCNFISIEVFTSPVETDESLLVLYLNAVSKNFLTHARNGYIYMAAVENVRKYLLCDKKDQVLANFLRKRISTLTNNELKKMLM